MGAAVVVVMSTVGGCGTGRSGLAEGDTDEIGLSGATDGSDGATATDTAADTSPGTMKFDLPIEDVPQEQPECAAVAEEARLVPVPADIFIVVDNSGSMSFEAGEVQARLNDFSNQIIQSGIDVHVVLVSSYPNEGNGICIDPPLGGGGCPDADSNPPLFTHVDEGISSHNAWEKLLQTHAQWADAVREESVKHIVIVSDDESNMAPDDFDADFQALDPSYAGYIHHSVVCHSDCPTAAEIGASYLDLSDRTAGVAADLCDQDFQAVFDVLSTEVIGGAALSCEFEIPAPPDGMDLQPDQVNLEFHDGNGGVLAVGRVESEAECTSVTDGWYYNDPNAPTMILLCPQTCTRAQDARDGSIQIAFGCATVPAG